MVILLLGLLVLAVVVGVPVFATIACLDTPRFVPDPKLRAVRLAVVAAVAAACGLVLYTLTTPWYTTTHNGDPNTVDGSSPLVAFIVAASLATGAGIVAGIHGCRNFSALPLLATWPVLAGAWFAATWYMPLGYSPPPPELQTGLPLATLAVGALTVLAGAGAIVRSCNLDPQPIPDASPSPADSREYPAHRGSLPVPTDADRSTTDPIRGDG
jgi:hypothetical protein